MPASYLVGRMTTCFRDSSCINGTAHSACWWRTITLCKFINLHGLILEIGDLGSRRTIEALHKPLRVLREPFLRVGIAGADFLKGLRIENQKIALRLAAQRPHVHPTCPQIRLTRPVRGEYTEALRILLVHKPALDHEIHDSSVRHLALMEDSITLHERQLRDSLVAHRVHGTFVNLLVVPHQRMRSEDGHVHLEVELDPQRLRDELEKFYAALWRVPLLFL
mmetsp:Transcript_86126/g.157824  ORF Transcript_86126/g.157824 Transcript_86126/m.157824 type:complete len:222 (-) Transcript_86126:172-837(-)